MRHFVVLAETLNYSRAAERLHMAQPPLSVSIQKLEAELGIKLFIRGPTGVALTASGAAALPQARKLLLHGGQLAQIAQDAATGTGGRLHIGFAGSAIYKLLPTLVPLFRAQFPEVELVLREDTTARIMAQLEDDMLDIGLVRTPLRSMLAIDKGIIFLPILVGVGHGHLNVIALEMNDRISYFLWFRLLPKQIQQSVPGKKLFTVVIQDQAGIQESIIPHQVIQVFRNEVVIPEHLAIGFKSDHGTVAVVGLSQSGVMGYHTLLEFRQFCLAFPERLNLEIVGQRIDGLGAHPIQPN